MTISAYEDIFLEICTLARKMTSYRQTENSIVLYICYTRAQLLIATHAHRNKVSYKRALNSKSLDLYPVELLLQQLRVLPALSAVDHQTILETKLLYRCSLCDICFVCVLHQFTVK